MDGRTIFVFSHKWGTIYDTNWNLGEKNKIVKLLEGQRYLTPNCKDLYAPS